MQLVNDLACPQCESPLDYQLMFEHEDEECGYLHCPNCLSSTPFVLGFPLFTETMATVDARHTSRLRELVTQIAPDERRYDQYIEQKFKRNIFEVYAAFQPFNESTRSIYPLVDAWKKHLRPGDLILDTWCRTGWSGELLASLFPQQRVLAIWEGNSSVLGYQGFYYWLNAKRRSPNLEIIFSPANLPFPVRSESAMLVHAYDSMHRKDLPKFADECLRAAMKKGILCFPHVHLDNNKPDPFFERGGQYRHGREYRKYFHDRLEKDGRKPLVMSEISMFQRNGNINLDDEADTNHYNGLILVAEENWYQQTFINGVEGKLKTDSRLIPNPLVSINPLTREAFLNKGALNDNVNYLLGRHPVYGRHIKSKLPMQLTGEQLALIAVAQSGANLQECAKSLNCPLDEVLTTAQLLVLSEIVAALPLSKTAFSLQQFHANNHTLFPRDFLSCWPPFLAHSPQSPFLLVEDEQLLVEEVSQVLVALCRYFKGGNNTPAGKLVIVGEINAERLMALMAAWSCGFTADLCEEQAIASTASIVVSDQGIPGRWKNITLASGGATLDNFWTVVEEFADTEAQLPVRSEQASVLNISGKELPWYRVSPLLTPWPAEYNDHLP